MLKFSHLSLALLIACCVGVAEPAVAQSVPEFLGVYAVTGGKLVELKALPRSGYRDMELMGTDVLTGSSGIVVDDPRVYFVIYREGASRFTSIFLEEMKQVRYNTPDEFSPGGLEPLENSWVSTKLGYNLKIAPLKDNPQMMVRAVWPDGIPPGRYGLNIEGVLYDLRIGTPKETCVVRQSSFAAGGAKYLDCEEFFAKYPNARPRGSRGTIQPDLSRSDASPGETIKRGNGTVSDSSTSLMWTTADNGAKIDFDGAKAYCDNLELDGFSDWRLPSLEEIAHNYVPAPGGSSSKNFGSTRAGLNLSTCCVWTSTPDEEGRGQFFSFASGHPRRLMIKAIDLRLMRAICVRQAG